MPGQRWRIDGRELSAHAAGRWALTPGRHTIVLAAAGSAEVVDSVEILVRGVAGAAAPPSAR
jgi:hypothetical protein